MCVCVQVSLHREKVTWPGAMIKKAGEGMPNYDDNTQRGSLYITIDVNFPRGTFSEEDREGECVEGEGVWTEKVRVCGQVGRV